MPAGSPTAPLPSYVEPSMWFRSGSARPTSACHAARQLPHAAVKELPQQARLLQRMLCVAHELCYTILHFA